MTEAAKILSLIESVSPDETALLDEIDARVWCFLREYNFEHLEHYTYNGKNIRRFRYNDNGTFGVAISKTQYTRSRDALKAIRPDGFLFDITTTVGNNDENIFYVSAKKSSTYWHVGSSPELPTEELAELQAIIQVIEYERTQK